MSMTSPVKKFLNKQLYLAGVCCAGILLVSPAVAHMAEANSAESRSNLLAQTIQDRQQPENNPEAERSSPAEATPSTSPPESSPERTTPPEQRTPASSSPIRTTPGTNTSTQGSNYTPGNWLCLHNPNPACQGR